MASGVKQYGDAALKLMNEPGVVEDAEKAIERMDRARDQAADARQKDYPPVKGDRRGIRIAVRVGAHGKASG